MYVRSKYDDIVNKKYRKKVIKFRILIKKYKCFKSMIILIYNIYYSLKYSLHIITNQVNLVKNQS